MEFRAHPDGSVTVEEGIVRMSWPTMDDLRAKSVPIGSAEIEARAVLFVVSLREQAVKDGKDPDRASDLETISRTREGGGR